MDAGIRSAIKFEKAVFALTLVWRASAAILGFHLYIIGIILKKFTAATKLTLLILVAGLKMLFR